VLPNPRVTFGRCFGEDFPSGIDSVFIVFFKSKGLRVLPNPRVTFGRCFGEDFPAGIDSVFIVFFKSTRASSAFESTRQLWKVFR
jgi:hypothetical protein